MWSLEESGVFIVSYLLTAGRRLRELYASLLDFELSHCGKISGFWLLGLSGFQVF